MKRQVSTLLVAAVFAVAGIGGIACGDSCKDDPNPVAASGAPAATGPVTIFHDNFEAGIGVWSDQGANTAVGPETTYCCEGTKGIRFWQDGASNSANTSDHVRRDFSTAATDTTTTFCFLVSGLNNPSTEPIIIHLQLGSAVMWSMAVTGAGGLQINQVAHTPNVGTILMGTMYSVTISHTGTTMTKLNIQATFGVAQADETGYTTAAAGPTPDPYPAMIHLTFGNVLWDAGFLVLDNFKVVTP